MKKLLRSSIFLLIALLSGLGAVSAQQKTASKDKIICLPQSVLRKAAGQLLLYDEYEQVLNYTDNNLVILNDELRLKDSIIQQDNVKLEQKDEIIDLTDHKYNLSQADNNVLKRDFKNFREKDKLKVGIGVTIITGLVYAWITKR